MLKIENTISEITLQTVEGYEGDAVNFSTPELLRFQTTLGNLHKAVPLAEFIYEDSEDPENPSEYLYKITAVDGRVWKQFIFDAQSDPNPLMNFKVNDLWRLNEFAPHREVRNAVVSLAYKYKVCYVKAEFIV